MRLIESGADAAAPWARVATILGLLMIIGSIAPSIANGQGTRGGIVLGDAEVVPVFGMILFVCVVWSLFKSGPASPDRTCQCGGSIG